MTYLLNGTKIDRCEFLRSTGSLAAWIDQAVKEAIEDGQPIPKFQTPLGPLVICK